MFSLEIINALNEPKEDEDEDVALARRVVARADKAKANREDFYQYEQAKVDALNEDTDSKPKANGRTLEISVNHGDTHDGRVTVTGYTPDPWGGFTISLDEFREALDEAGYGLVDADKLTLTYPEVV